MKASNLFPVVATALACAPVGAAFPQYTGRIIPPPAPQVTSYFPWDINDRGEVSGNLFARGIDGSWYYDGTTSRVLSYPNRDTYIYEAIGLSESGLVSIYPQYGAGQYYEWIDVYNIRTGEFQPVVRYNSDRPIRPNDVNDSGYVVGSQYEGNYHTYNPIVIRDQQVIRLPKRLYQGFAKLINNAGQIAGRTDRDFTYWENDQILFAGSLPGHLQSVAFGMNEHGHVVGESMVGLNGELQFGPYNRTRETWNGNDTAAFLYADGVMSEVLTPGPHARAWDLNNHGWVVGLYFAEDFSSYGPFLTIGNTTADLNSLLTPDLADWQILSAERINNHGHIVARAMINNQELLVMLTPIPEPAAGAALAGLLGIAAARSRRYTSRKCL